MKKKYLGLICLLYAGIIMFVNHYNILRNFLAPRMQMYLICSVPIFILIATVIFYSDKFHYHFKVTDLVLLLPLVMIIMAGDGRLTLSASSNRISNIKREKVVKKESTKKDPKIDESKLDFTNPYFDVDDEIYLDLGNYLTYNSKAEDFIGKTIRLKGFTVGNSDYLPNGLYGLGKYGVSCCVADAGFMGYVIKANGHKINNNTWYEVEGYIERNKDLSGHDIFPITVVNIKEIDGEKEEEYVYPCYTYGDGSCSKMKKYNLKY